MAQIDEVLSKISQDSDASAGAESLFESLSEDQRKEVFKLMGSKLHEQFGNNSTGFSTQAYTEYLREQEHLVTGGTESAIFKKISRNKKEIIQSVDAVRDFYLVNAILSTMVEDALKPNVVTDEVVNVFYKKAFKNGKIDKNNKVQREIDDLDKKFNFDNLATDVAEEVLAYGEFIYNAKVSKEGLVDIEDNSDQESIIPITKHGEVVSYLIPGKKHGKVDEKKEYEFIRFKLGNKKIRVKLEDSIWRRAFSLFAKQPRKLKKFPRYVRLGRSAIYPIIGKIRELDLLEKLVPASKLSQLAAGSLVGMSVPENTRPSDALEAVRKVEDSLNRRRAVDQTNQVQTVEDIVSAAGSYKVIPVYGQSGEIRRMDYKSQEPEELLRSVQDIRRNICSTIGFPYEIFYGDEQGRDKKGDILRRYARYLSILRSLQIAIIEGIKQIVVIHLSNKEGAPSFTYEDIEVECVNKLVNIAETEKLEFVDVSVSMLENVVKFVNELGMQFGHEAVNKKDVAEFISDYMQFAGINKLIDSKKVTNKPPEGEGGLGGGRF